MKIDGWLVVIVAIVAAVAGYAVYAQTQVDMKRAEIEAKINAQTEIDRIKIEEAEATKRTRERMQMIPWYSGKESVLPTEDK
jgi:cell division protein FtsL